MTTDTSLNQIKHLALNTPEPEDYLSGTREPLWCAPENILIFHRKTRKELQRKTIESRPHHRFVLILNLESSGIVNINGNPYPLKKNQAHLVFPYQFHTYHDVEFEKISWIFFTFELLDSSLLEELRHLTIPLNASIIEIVQALIENYQKKSHPISNQKITLLMGLLLTQLLEDSHHHYSHPTPIKGRSSEMIHKIHGLQQKKLPDPLSISEVAKALNLSESRLRTIFRQSFGMSLGNYLRNFRLHKAVAMIQNSNASLTEIALSCGFSSSSTFSRSFKAWSGKSPYAFRSQKR